MAPVKGRVASLKKEVAAPLTPQRKALADKNAQLEAEVEKLTKALNAAALDAKSTLEKLDEKENANRTLSAKVQKLQKIQTFKPQLVRQALFDHDVRIAEASRYLVAATRLCCCLPF